MLNLSCASDFKSVRLGKCICVTMLILLFVCVNDAMCESPGIELPAEAAPEPTMLESLDTPRDELSQEILEFSTKIDHFFGDPRYYQESNNSVIQIFLNQSIEESGNLKTWIDGQAKIDLPSAEKRFHLVLETDPEKKAGNETKQDQVTPPKDQKTPTNYAASLRYEKAQEGLWHFSADSGANVQFPLDPFVRTRGSYELPLEDWKLKLADTVFWFSTLGLGNSTQFDMEHVLSKDLLFRATTSGTCFESPQLCNLRQDLSFYHTVDERSALLYQMSVLGDDNPKLRDTNYILLMRYRYKMHREWMYFEVTPQIFFPRTDNFHLNASLLLRLEMLFGATN